MVRRTAEEFAAGAKPVKGSGSHRLVEQKIRLTPELRNAIREAAQIADCTDVMWVRAAARKALREGIDVEHELSTTVELPSLSPPEKK